MDQEIMQFKTELQELVHKGQQLLQKMDSSYGQRGGYYGMRDNGGQGGGYNQGGNYGNREPWMQQMPPQMPGQGWPNGQQMPGGNFPNIDPRFFM